MTRRRRRSACVCRTPGSGAGTSMRSRRQVAPPLPRGQHERRRRPGCPSRRPRRAGSRRRPRSSARSSEAAGAASTCGRRRACDQILSSATSTPWRASAKATSASWASPNDVRFQVAPPSVVRRTAETPGSPAAPRRCPTIQACRRRRRRSPSTSRLHLLHHGPAGAAVGGREHRAGVGDEPAGLRVGEGHVHAALRQEEPLALPGRAAVGGDEQDARLAGGPGAYTGSGRRGLPEGVLRRLSPAAAAAGEESRVRRARPRARVPRAAAPASPSPRSHQEASVHDEQ